MNLFFSGACLQGGRIYSLQIIGWLGALLLLCAGWAGFQLQDPVGDDYGAGSLTYPTSSYYRPGDLDLRRLSVTFDDQTVTFKIMVTGSFEKPDSLRLNPLHKIELNNHIYTSNIDIYIDKDHKPNSGETQALPGRDFGFVAESAWEQVICVTPQPFYARNILTSWNPALAKKVIWASSNQEKGRVLQVRIPIREIGMPQPGWGWFVCITGAKFEGSFNLVDTLKGERQSDLFVRGIGPIPDEESFGGGLGLPLEPKIIDGIFSNGLKQESILDLSQIPTGAMVQVKTVYP